MSAQWLRADEVGPCWSLGIEHPNSGEKKTEDTQIWILDKQQIGFLVYVYPKYYMHHAYAKRLFVAYSKFKFNGVPFSGRRYLGIEAAWIFGQKTPAHSP